MDEEHETFGKTINTWVQTIGIVMAGVWGLYTFVYKEIVVPKSAPVNITMDLSLKRMQEQRKGGKGGLTPIEVTVSAKNPSSREVYILPTVWVAYGLKISPIAVTELPEIKIDSSAISQSFIDRYAKTTSRALVALGRLIPDTSLKPGEVVTRRLVFFVPSGMYDMVDVQAAVPTVAEQGKIDLAWSLGKNEMLTSILFKIGSDRKPTQMQASEITESFRHEHELQTSSTTAHLSLW